MVVSPRAWHYRGRVQVRNKDPPSPGKAAQTEIPALGWGEEGKAFAHLGTSLFSKREKAFAALS